MVILEKESACGLHASGRNSGVLHAGFYYFAIDITTCPQCGGPLTILAAIEDPAVIGKILSHLGLPTRAPPQAPARLGEFLQTASSPTGFRFSGADRSPLPISPAHTPQWSAMLTRS